MTPSHEEQQRLCEISWKSAEAKINELNHALEIEKERVGKLVRLVRNAYNEGINDGYYRPETCIWHMSLAEKVLKEVLQSLNLNEQENRE